MIHHEIQPNLHFWNCFTSKLFYVNFLITEKKLGISKAIPVSKQYGLPVFNIKVVNKVMSGCSCNASGYFAPEKKNIRTKIAIFLTKWKIDKHTLTQDHHTCAFFLYLVCLFGPYLMNHSSRISHSLSSSIYYMVFKWWQST